MTNIAFLGLGAMGSRMAQRLLLAGHRVTVWNRTPAAAQALLAQGALWAATPRAAAANQELVFSMVRDHEASQFVWLDEHQGALAALAENALAVECSTLSVAWINTLAAAFSTRGRFLVEAPVAGSRPQADAAKLIFFVGAAAEHLVRIEPALSLMGAAVHHTGAVGSGTLIKLCVNALLATQQAVMAELIALLATHGLPVIPALEVIGATPVCSPAAVLAAKAMCAEQFAPQFPVALVLKDLGYLQEAQALPANSQRVTQAVEAQFQQAANLGLAQENITAIAKLYC